MIVVTGYLDHQPRPACRGRGGHRHPRAAHPRRGRLRQYRYATDVLEPNQINIWEQWESQDAMDAHMGTAHLADFMGVMGTCIGGPLEITRHDIASSSKIF